MAVDEETRAVLARARATMEEGASTSKRAIAAHKRNLRRQLKMKEEVELLAERLGLNLQITTTETRSEEGAVDD